MFPISLMQTYSDLAGKLGGIKNTKDFSKNTYENPFYPKPKPTRTTEANTLNSWLKPRLHYSQSRNRSYPGSPVPSSSLSQVPGKRKLHKSIRSDVHLIL